MHVCCMSHMRGELGSRKTGQTPLGKVCGVFRPLSWGEEMWKRHRLWRQRAKVQIPAYPVSSCVTSGNNSPSLGLLCTPEAVTNTPYRWL